MTNRVLLLAGPTASGKTGLALSIAAQLGPDQGVEVVNADSMQVYRDLAVITARPTAEECAAAPHHLFGHVDGACRYSVGAWVRAACDTIADIHARGAVPLLVGGTGLYFRALTVGLAAIPEPGEAARGAAQAILDTEGMTGLRARAEALDPAAAAGVQGDDPQRLLRIVAVAEGLGRPLSAFQADTRPSLSPGTWAGVVLAPERLVLRARIAARASAMIADPAAWAEVETFLARGLDGDLPAMKALGVEALGAVLRGKATQADAEARLTTQTHQYAKRQDTWFRNQTADWPRIAAPDVMAALAALGLR